MNILLAILLPFFFRLKKKKIMKYELNNAGWKGNVARQQAMQYGNQEMKKAPQAQTMST